MSNATIGEEIQFSSSFFCPLASQPLQPLVNLLEQAHLLVSQPVTRQLRQQVNELVRGGGRVRFRLLDLFAQPKPLFHHLHGGHVIPLHRVVVNLGISQRRLKPLMPHQGLHRQDGTARIDQLRGKGVAQAVGGHMHPRFDLLTFCNQRPNRVQVTGLS